MRERTNTIYYKTLFNNCRLQFNWKQSQQGIYVAYLCGQATTAETIDV